MEPQGAKNCIFFSKIIVDTSNVEYVCTSKWSDRCITASLTFVRKLDVTCEKYHTLQLIHNDQLLCNRKLVCGVSLVQNYHKVVSNCTISHAIFNVQT